MTRILNHHTRGLLWPYSPVLETESVYVARTGSCIGGAENKIFLYLSEFSDHQRVLFPNSCGTTAVHRIPVLASRYCCCCSSQSGWPSPGSRIKSATRKGLRGKHRYEKKTRIHTMLEVSVPEAIVGAAAMLRSARKHLRIVPVIRTTSVDCADQCTRPRTNTGTMFGVKSQSTVQCTGTMSTRNFEYFLLEVGLSASSDTNRAFARVSFFPKGRRRAHSPLRRV